MIFYSGNHVFESGERFFAGSKLLNVPEKTALKVLRGIKKDCFPIPSGIENSLVFRYPENDQIICIFPFQQKLFLSAELQQIPTESFQHRVMSGV